MSTGYHLCKEMSLAIKEFRKGDKLEISKIRGIPHMEVVTNRYDSLYGDIEESIFIPINFCPFCGIELVNLN